MGQARNMSDTGLDSRYRSGMRRARFSNRHWRLIPLLAAVLAGAAGCGEDFEPANELHSLRVLAVRASNPYPKPGETITLQMLWTDGRVTEQPPVHIAWIGGCFNPAGDLYYGCYPQLASLLAAAPSDPNAAKYLGQGDSFDLSIPEDIVTSHPPAEGVDPYGVAFVFFALCKGTLGPVQDSASGLPIGCFDSAGTRLGPDDFVPGFLALYSYPDQTNRNPTIVSLNFEGQPMTEQPVHVPRCQTDDCPKYDLRVVVDPASVEPDPGVVDPQGQPLTEQMWVNYYITGGELSSGAKLVNDATKGFNTDTSTEYEAPREAGQVRVYAVVHDNRGGVEWIERVIMVD